VIWDRDYMKRQEDQSKVADAASTNSENPTPFNLFAGLEPEPLKPGESIQTQRTPGSENSPAPQPIAWRSSS
jgi:hypothetical protein